MAERVRLEFWLSEAEIETAKRLCDEQNEKWAEVRSGFSWREQLLGIALVAIKKDLTEFEAIRTQKEKVKTESLPSVQHCPQSLAPSP